ncbi:glycosyl hydrolase [Phenylobacterium sp. LjRoot219]|uniref:GH39 family glycosyl hydrolase n=1 Tax=Phenylobacterium sp. LjRoot219 TaxID=3342283 RepID=UPI003ECFF1EA
MNRRQIMGSGASLLAVSAFGGGARAQAPVEAVEVDLRREVGPLRRVWEQSVGSDRAGVTLREDWRKDARRVRNELGVQRVRFHGIFDDEVGVAPKGALGRTMRGPNFQNVDAIYDGLMEMGLRPFVELSFMPTQLASGPRTFGTYRANITPPTSLADWGALVAEFARHLIGRYGATEVRQWYFEVWNEPNLPFFWSGTQADYFELYRTTVTALKGVDPALKVGGPSTSAIQWIPEFLDFCAKNNLPVDFIGTHIYAGDKQEKMFGQAGLYSQNDVIPAAMKKVREQIAASKFPKAELWLSEWSSDSPAMIAHIIKGCLPYCDGMSYWQLSGTFEEVFVPDYLFKEGDNGWGLMSQRGVVRPAFNTFKLMHRLGERQLEATGPALAARGQSGAAVMVWNLAEVLQPAGIPGARSERKVTGQAKRLQVTLKGAKPGQNVKVTFVDQERGSPYPTWRALGSPQYPTPDQLGKIRAAAELPAPEIRKLGAGGELVLELPPEGVALIELK